MITSTYRVSELLGITEDFYLLSAKSIMSKIAEYIMISINREDAQIADCQL
jgi:hypothetical protein